MIKVAGYNRHRQLIAESNDPTNNQRINPPLIIDIGSNIRSFSTYAHHSVKIDDKGRCYAIGKDDKFRIGSPNRKTYTEFTEIQLDNNNDPFISAFCGAKFTLYITETHKLILCSEFDAHPIPRIFTLNTKPISLFGGSDICAIIDEHGDIYIIIPSAIYQKINKNSEKSDFYHLNPSLHLSCPALTVACGNNVIYILTIEGEVFIQKLKQDSLIENCQKLTIETVNPEAKLVKIGGTSNGFFVVDSDGHVYGFSLYQKFNQLGTNNEDSNKKFVFIESLQDYKIDSAFSGVGHSAFITRDGQLLTCGSNRFRQLMINDFNEHHSPVPLKVDIGKSNRASFAIVGNAITVIFLNSVPKHCPNQANNLIMRPSSQKKVSAKRYKPKISPSNSPQPKPIYSKTMRTAKKDSFSEPSSPISSKPFPKKLFDIEKPKVDDEEINTETKLKLKEEENEKLKKKANILMKILRKKTKSDTEKRFIELDEFNELQHVEYLSQTPLIDVSKVCKKSIENEYFTMKIFKAANYKEFKKFYREFEIISSIRHPCIVKFYRYSNSVEGIEHPLLIVDYLPYNLRELMTNYKTDLSFSSFPFTSTEKVKIIIDIAFGLKFLHEEKIMHRNLKPENIMITKKYHAKIGDFAWANSIDIDLSYSKKGTGSLLYMAPELMNGDDYDEKIDQFAFGRLMQFILCDGVEPEFNMNDVENGITFKRVPELNDLSARIIQSCCSYDSDDRPTFPEIIEMIQNGDFKLLPDVDSEELKERLMKLEILEEIDNPKES